MNNTKKRFSYLLVSLLLFCMMQICTAYAATSPSLYASADAAGASKGSYVNVSIKLRGNPSISTLGVALGYDSSVLKYDNTSWSGGFSGSDMKMTSDTGSEVNLSVVCDSSYSTDGIIATVRFRAVSDASSIPVTLSLRDMADKDLSEVSNCKVSSQVHVPKTTGTKSDTVQPEVKGSSTNSAKNTVSVKNTKTRNATVKKAQTSSSSKAESSKPDQNYKTGAGMGYDIWLIVAIACGMLALILAVQRHEE